MGQQTNEMVYVEILWHEPGEIRMRKDQNPYRNRLWFMIMADTPCPVSAKGALACTDYLRAEIIFEPMQAEHFPITPYRGYIEMEMDDVGGMEEAFGAGYDVETIGAYAYKHREDDSMFQYFQGFIALYSVYTYTIHRNEGNDSETEYELLGILDMSKLPSALVSMID